jgi:hypothetical protein
MPYAHYEGQILTYQPDLSGRRLAVRIFLRSTTGGLNFGEQQHSFQYRELLAKREVFKKPRATTVEGSGDRTRWGYNGVYHVRVLS